MVTARSAGTSIEVQSSPASLRKSSFAVPSVACSAAVRPTSSATAAVGATIAGMAVATRAAVVSVARLVRMGCSSMLVVTIDTVYMSMVLTLT